MSRQEAKLQIQNRGDVVWIILMIELVDSYPWNRIREEESFRRCFRDMGMGNVKVIG